MYIKTHVSSREVSLAANLDDGLLIIQSQGVSLLLSHRRSASAGGNSVPSVERLQVNYMKDSSIHTVLQPSQSVVDIPELLTDTEQTCGVPV
ncbi:unnamed protein product [Merluccius merluccius]